MQVGHMQQKVVVKVSHSTTDVTQAALLHVYLLIAFSACGFLCRGQLCRLPTSSMPWSRHSSNSSRIIKLRHSQSTAKVGDSCATEMINGEQCIVAFTAVQYLAVVSEQQLIIQIPFL